MNIAQKIKDYQNNLVDKTPDSSIFLDLVDDIIMNFPYRLNKKTYLLIPDQRKELIEMTYEYFLSNRKTIPISLSLNISQIMNKFKEVAQELGFTVITKMDEYHNDGELFDLLGTDSKGKGSFEEEYNKFPGVRIPLTLTVDEFATKPFFPVVFKNNTANRGEDKYLIENDEQLKKILALFELPESKKINLKNEFVVQEYIKSFEGMNSSIRVYINCTGDVLCSLFLVSMNETPNRRVKQFGIDVFNPCEYLNDPNSPYYLNSKNIISNVAGGGRAIPLHSGTSNLSAKDEIVLTLHGFNVETLTLPKDIIQQCQAITMYWGTKKGIVLGIDFIYNSNDNKWYYLESNRNPSVVGYSHFMNLKGYLTKDVKALMQFDSLMKLVENIMNKDMLIEGIKRNK